MQKKPKVIIEELLKRQKRQEALPDCKESFSHFVSFSLRKNLLRIRRCSQTALKGIIPCFLRYPHPFDKKKEFIFCENMV